MISNQTKGTVVVDGFSLDYCMEGRGIPTLIIGSNRFYARAFSKELREHLQLIFMDHRGFVAPPEEPLENSAYALDILLQDIEALRRHLNLEQFLIVGHSGHAFMALEYAKKFPQHVLGSVMIGVSPDYSEAMHQATDAFFETTASAERKDLYAKNMAKLPGLIQAKPEKRFVDYCLCAGPRNWFQYDFDAAALWEGVETNMQMIDYVWGKVFRDIDITKDLDKLEKPVLLALGKYDYVTGPPSLWDKVVPVFKHIQVELFEESAHYPQFEQPAEFDEKLLAWAIENKLIDN
ncbi:alpha/beta hydrolase [Rapidithrix thailandica]|uniref:Alpha/beta hydrolase n=1 Tax=Rapidithrix thailandica TaxID=413964 RepID=A0AAW9SGI7_9BACT